MQPSQSLSASLRMETDLRILSQTAHFGCIFMAFSPNITFSCLGLSAKKKKSSQQQPAGFSAGSRIFGVLSQGFGHCIPSMCLLGHQCRKQNAGLTSRAFHMMFLRHPPWTHSGKSRVHVMRIPALCSHCGSFMGTRSSPVMCIRIMWIHLNGSCTHLGNSLEMGAAWLEYIHSFSCHF